jgi:hypothetical protein
MSSGQVCFFPRSSGPWLFFITEFGANGCFLSRRHGEGAEFTAFYWADCKGLLGKDLLRRMDRCDFIKGWVNSAFVKGVGRQRFVKGG